MEVFYSELPCTGKNSLGQPKAKLRTIVHPSLVLAFFEQMLQDIIMSEKTKSVSSEKNLIGVIHTSY